MTSEKELPNHEKLPPPYSEIPPGSTQENYHQIPTEPNTNYACKRNLKHFSIFT